MLAIITSVIRKMFYYGNADKRMGQKHSVRIVTRDIPFEGEFSNEKFESYLYSKILKNLTKNDAFVVFSEPNRVAISLAKRLRKHSFRLGVISTKDTRELERYGVRYFRSLDEIAKIGERIEAIVVMSPLSRVIHQVFDEVKRISALEQTLFIYKVRGSETYPSLNEHDQLRELGIADTHVYITSEFDDGLFDDIYRYSLTKVKRKCQVRDAYDLFQCLKHVEWINGDIIEFGSYQGHSGLLMAEFIRRKNLKKRLYLCDTFKGFPEENYGIDREWSSTNPVDFSQVKALFEPYEFVELVKGEFQKTVDRIPSETLSLAMIDCDTYRSTSFVADFIYPKLVRGGILVFEDYGHHDLLGARRAVDEFLADKQGCIYSMFSFFSGINVVVKIA